MILGMALAAAAPMLGLWVGLIFLLVPLFAIFKPLPSLHLGNRGFSFSVSSFVGLTTTLASIGAESERVAAELRETNPTAYLEALESRDKDKWLAELEELAPERYKKEAAKAEAKRQAEQEAEIAAYIAQLDREIASIPGLQATKYTKDMRSINMGLVILAAWAAIYEDGDKLQLTEEAQAKRKQFRRAVVSKQIELLPALRDAYGSVMRKELWEADASARTIGKGYRTAEFVSVAFAANANIKKIHTDLQEHLTLLRFTRAQYKWFKQASEYSYFTIDVPKDSDIVVWEKNGRYRVLD